MTTTQILSLTCLSMAAALVTVLSGCGGGNDSTEAQLTKKQFVTRAASICEATEKTLLEDVVVYRKQHPSLEEEGLVKPVLVPALEKQVRQLKALGTPSGDQGSIESMTAQFEAALQRTKQDPSVVTNAATNPFEKYDKLAKETGLIECSHAP